MVALPEVQASNARLPSSLQDPVAVFVGATSGIGSYSLLAFAQHTTKPRVYIVGRSSSAGERLAKECQTLCPSGTFTFLAVDCSLMHNIDEACNTIKAQEKYINVLYQSQGNLFLGETTSEGLHSCVAVAFYGNIRFIRNLLPLLNAPSPSGLKRVVTTFAAGKEGRIYENDMQGFNLPLRGARGHLSSLVTFAMETLSLEASDVAFVHDFPGFVKSNLVRGGEGWAIAMMGMVSKLTERFHTYISNVECGERHLFLATSARFPPASSTTNGSKPKAAAGAQVARGSTGELGSGMYCIDENCESAGSEATLRQLRADGVREKVWRHTIGELDRIDGKKAAV